MFLYAAITDDKLQYYRTGVQMTVIDTKSNSRTPSPNPPPSGENGGGRGRSKSPDPEEGGDLYQNLEGDRGDGGQKISLRVTNAEVYVSQRRGSDA